MGEPACRACREPVGDLVLDLGEQPACDYFPRYDDPGPDPVYPLQMWLCSSCGLAQLVADPTVPEEPRGAEPAALVAQARRRREPGRRGRVAARRRPGRRVRQPARRLLAGAAGRPRAHAGARTANGRRGPRLFRPDARGGPVRGARRAGGPGGARAGCCCCSTTRWPRSSATGSGTRSGTGTTRTTRRPLWPPCWPRTASARAWRGISSSTAARCCWRPAGTPTRRSGRTARCGRCSRKRRGPVSVTLPRSAASSTTRRPGRGAARLAGRRAVRREPCSGTAPPHARSRCCAGREWTARCCPRWSTPRPPNRACGCPGPTSRSSTRRGSPHDQPDAVLLFLADLMHRGPRGIPRRRGRWRPMGRRRCAAGLARGSLQ